MSSIVTFLNPLNDLRKLLNCWHFLPIVVSVLNEIHALRSLDLFRPSDEKMIKCGSSNEKRNDFGDVNSSISFKKVKTSSILMNWFLMLLVRDFEMNHWIMSCCLLNVLLSKLLNVIFWNGLESSESDTFSDFAFGFLGLSSSESEKSEIFFCYFLFLSFLFKWIGVFFWIWNIFCCFWLLWFLFVWIRIRNLLSYFWVFLVNVHQNLLHLNFLLLFACHSF